jgi:hypothetical protein
LAANWAADRRAFAPGSDAGKDGAESGAWRRLGSVPCLGNDDGALRVGCVCVAAEFAGDSDRKLFCLSVADCAAHSIFFRGRETIRCAASTAVGRPDFGRSAREFLGRHSILVDDDMARDGCVVFGRTCVCGIGICGSGSGLATCGEKDSEREDDRLKSVPLHQEIPARGCRGLLRSV